MRVLLLLFLMAALLAAEAYAEIAPGKARVAVPVADLRKEPTPRGPTPEHDPLQESQLLFGDPVTVVEVQGEWARVVADDQQEWTHNRRWEGYPGWMRVADLTAEPLEQTGKPKTRTGYTVPGTDIGTDVRERIVQAARGFIGIPYLWGGRSPEALDCSGLTGLSYQIAGVRIPRDAHEQWMKARPISRKALQPGDLIFLSDPNDALKITHVMLYAGDGTVIEGPGTGSAVREIDLEERLKESPDRRVHYGAYLSGHGEPVEP